MGLSRAGWARIAADSTVALSFWYVGVFECLAGKFTYQQTELVAKYAPDCKKSNIQENHGPSLILRNFRLPPQRKTPKRAGVEEQIFVESTFFRTIVMEHWVRSSYSIPALGEAEMRSTRMNNSSCCCCCLHIFTSSHHKSVPVSAQYLTMFVLVQLTRTPFRGHNQVVGKKNESIAHHGREFAFTAGAIELHQSV